MRCNQLGTILLLHLKDFRVIYTPCLFCAPTEQHLPGRDLPVDQPQGDGVAAVCGPRRIRAQPERQRRARRPDGETAEPSVIMWNGNSLLDASTPKRVFPPQVLEPRFNVETMALLLNIPPNKTLLRRHLATHFSLLIGAEAQQSKQECLENPDYIVLTATTKVKVMQRFQRSGC